MKIIQVMSPADIKICAGIWLEASIAGHDFIPAEFWRKQLPVMVEKYLPSAILHMVCIAENSPAAFSAVSGNTLAALFVQPEHWGKGIGTALLCNLLKIYSPLELAVYAQNQRAIRFYTKIGFKMVSNGLCAHTGEPEIIMLYSA